MKNIVSCNCFASDCGNKVCCTHITNMNVTILGQVILKDVNLHLHCGELTAIVGRNGAGKTTFLKALLGQVKYTGQITFQKENTHTMKKPRFGYVPQTLFIEKNIPVTVEDMVLCCLSSRPVWLPHTKKEKLLVQDTLKMTDAQNLCKKKLGDLSGGEIQRVMLSLAVSPLPDILLLDEPVAAVDRIGTMMFYDLASDLRHKFDMTILLVSHDLDLVAKKADRVILMDHGITATGSPKDVYSTQAFIDTFGKIAID